MDRLLWWSEAVTRMCSEKKVENCKYTCKGNHISKNMNYNTTFVKWIYPSIALMALIFLEYFVSEHFSSDPSEHLQHLSKY